MSNNEIDNWYKQHIEQVSGPAYSDSYWEKAQLFIARAERIRKLGILSYALLILLLGTFLGSYFLQPNLLDHNLPTQVIANSKETTYLDNRNGLIDAAHEDIANNLAEVAQVQKEKEAINSDFIDKQGNAEITKSNRSSSTNIDAKKYETSRIVRQEVKVSDQSGPNNSASEASKAMMPYAPGISSDDLSSTETNGLAISEHTSPLEKANNALELSTSDSEVLVANNKLISRHGLQLLPTLNREFLQMNDEAIEIRFSNPSIVLSRQLPRNKWSNGIMLTVPTGVLRSSDRQVVMGFNLSVLQTYTLTNSLAIGAGLGYSNRRGALGVQKDHPNAIYDYELVDKGHRITLTELHQLAIPFQLSQRIGKTSVHLGYQLNFLVSAYGKLESYHREFAFHETFMSQSTHVNSTTFGQVNTNGIRNLSHDISLRVTYPVAKHLSLGLGASYWISGYFESDFGVSLDRRTKKYFNAYSSNKAFDKGAFNLELAMYYNL